MRDTILYGDCLKTLDTLKSHISIGICDKPRMCVTSPPYYGLRDYGGEDNQIGHEDTPEEFISNLVNIFFWCLFLSYLTIFSTIITKTVIRWRSNTHPRFITYSY